MLAVLHERMPQLPGLLVELLAAHRLRLQELDSYAGALAKAPWELQSVKRDGGRPVPRSTRGRSAPAG